MINDLSIYNDTLPALIYPATLAQAEPTKYLGNRFVENDLVLNIPYVASTKESITNLYNFWKDDCERGSKLFILTDIDIFGISTKFAVKWVGGLSSQWKTATSFSGTLSLIVKYTVDENNELIEYKGGLDG